MYVINWSDNQKSYSAVGDTDTIYQIYSYILKEKYWKNGELKISNIHIYSLSNGLECDPENGLRSKIWTNLENKIKARGKNICSYEQGYQAYLDKNPYENLENFGQQKDEWNQGWAKARKDGEV